MLNRPYMIKQRLSLLLFMEGHLECIPLLCNIQATQRCRRGRHLGLLKEVWVSSKCHSHAWQKWLTSILWCGHLAHTHITSRLRLVVINATAFLNSCSRNAKNQRTVLFPFLTPEATLTEAIFCNVSTHRRRVAHLLRLDAILGGQRHIRRTRLALSIRIGTIKSMKLLSPI